MIETRLLGDSPAIVHHRVSGRLSEVEALAGVDEAIAVIERLIKTQSVIKGDRFIIESQLISEIYAAAPKPNLGAEQANQPA